MSRGPAPWKSSDEAWRGARRPYDLLKEVTISGIVVAILVAGLSLLFASPDPTPITFREWALKAQGDFASTTLSEIDQTSLSATYGPPYQTTSQNGSTQGFGPISPEKWFGQGIPINTWKDYVATPLGTLGDPKVDAAMAEWAAAGADQQQAWSKAAGAVLGTSAPKFPLADQASLGPIPTLINAQLDMARSGALDQALLYTNAKNTQGNSVWYSDDQTRALLYFGDSGQGGAASDCISPGDARPADGGCWYCNLAVDNSAPRFGGYLAGDTFGVINEVGNWPGAWWLFPYSFWYQWGPGTSSGSADLYAMLMTALISLPFILLPFIPGLRNIPKATRVYKLMWSDYYRDAKESRRE